MEMRVIMCQTGSGSAGVRCAPPPAESATRTPFPFAPHALTHPRRDFFAKNYASLKAANAKLPILLRENQGSAAKVTATYGAALMLESLDGAMSTTHLLACSAFRCNIALIVPLHAPSHRVWRGKISRPGGSRRERCGQPRAGIDEGIDQNKDEANGAGWARARSVTRESIR